MTGKSALLFGTSGLVGGELLKYLLEADEYDRVQMNIPRFSIIGSRVYSKMN